MKASEPRHDQWISRARAFWASDDIEFDEDARVSIPDDSAKAGAWVQGWVWVQSLEPEDSIQHR